MMIERMKEHDEAVRKRFREQRMPYFSYRLGEKSFGITRIGKWKTENKYWDEKELKEIKEVKRFNVTPKKMEKILRTFRNDIWLVETHLYLKDLPGAEEWKAAFPDAVIDE